MKKYFGFLLIFFLLFPNIFLSAQEDRILLLHSRFDINWGNSNNVKIISLIPKDIEGLQKVEQIEFSIVPDTIYEVEGNKYADFIIEKKDNKLDNVEITTLLNITQNDLEKIKKRNKKRTQIESFERYLTSEEYMEVDDPSIQKIASKLKKNKDLKTAENIYKFVTKTIKYDGYNPNNVGAKQALIKKKGDCTEFTDLFVTLCRACSIPAKHIIGYVTGAVNVPQHSWAEVYLDDLGWVQIEVTPGNDANFKKIIKGYINMSETRLDKNLQNKYFFWMCYWKGNAKPSIRNSIIVKEYRKRKLEK